MTTNPGITLTGDDLEAAQELVVEDTVTELTCLEDDGFYFDDIARVGKLARLLKATGVGYYDEEFVACLDDDLVATLRSVCEWNIRRVSRDDDDTPPRLFELAEQSRRVLAVLEAAS